MKRTTIMVLCTVFVLSFVGCGNKATENGASPKSVSEKAKEGDTTVRIEEIVYYNTRKAIPVEPDESVIIREELPLQGSVSGEKITAYAFTDEILVCLIDGEWYQFIATERAGQP